HHGDGANCDRDPAPAAARPDRAAGPAGDDRAHWPSRRARLEASRRVTSWCSRLPASAAWLAEPGTRLNLAESGLLRLARPPAGSGRAPAESARLGLADRAWLAWLAGLRLAGLPRAWRCRRGAEPCLPGGLRDALGGLLPAGVARARDRRDL